MPFEGVQVCTWVVVTTVGTGQVVVVQLLPELPAAAVHEATATGPVVVGPTQVVLVQLLAADGEAVAQV